MERDMPWARARLEVHCALLYPSPATADKPSDLVRTQIRDQKLVVCWVWRDLVQVRALLALHVWPCTSERRRVALRGEEIRRLGAQGHCGECAGRVLYEDKMSDKLYVCGVE